VLDIDPYIVVELIVSTCSKEASEVYLNEIDDCDTVISHSMTEALETKFLQQVIDIFYICCFRCSQFYAVLSIQSCMLDKPFLYKFRIVYG